MAALRYGEQGVHWECSLDSSQSHVRAAILLELLLEVGISGPRNPLVHPHLGMEPVVGLGVLRPGKEQENPLILRARQALFPHSSKPFLHS